MLELREVHSLYGSALVLQGVSLAVPERAVVALLGRNGMGKTTLIRSIMGFAQPRVSAGTIRYRDHSLVGRSPHAIARLGIGLVPQGRRLFGSLTVVEHLSLLSPRRLAKGDWSLERIFALFPALADRRRHRASQLSGGERQMLAIGRALMTSPSLLLMDEPSEGLSPVMVQHLEGIVRSLTGVGLAILLVEQNLHSALSSADEVYLIENGRIVYRDKPDRLRNERETLRRYLGV
ncbi:MAG TPA: ABC transporter ATP-binding protein [Candidatus Baltobacteraceae bacterium]|nr:ABC transporter ATP-binding protein [Candidatus Baltobacteraceae bacterium]